VYSASRQSNSSHYLNIGVGSRFRTDRARTALHSWYQRLGELWEYKEEHGDCLVPQVYTKNKKLAAWVNKVRMEQRKLVDQPKDSSLTPDKLQALEEVGFVWAKVKGRAGWDLKYKELVAYHAAHGHCNVPTKYRVS
jgi:Helicase associated domain